MKVINAQKIQEFMDKHPDSSEWLKAWLAEARNGGWNSPMELKNRFSSASIVDGNRVIFNVKGNNYRMETKVSFKNEVISVLRLGTHAEYDRWK